MDEYIKREAVDKVFQLRLADKDLWTEAEIQIAEWLKADIDEIQAADVEPTDRWINAQTNPPIATDGLSSDYVLVLRTSGRQCVCYYVYDDGGNYWCSEDEKSMYDIDEVTHWQPLPKLPKTKKG